MKIQNQNIYSGNQQFADLIINQSSVFDESDVKFLELIHKNTDTAEERKKLVESLEFIKSDQVDENEKKVAGGLLKKFLGTGVAETSKQIVKEIFEYGGEYLQYLT